MEVDEGTQQDSGYKGYATEAVPNIGDNEQKKKSSNQQMPSFDRNRLIISVKKYMYISLIYRSVYSTYAILVQKKSGQETFLQLFLHLCCSLSSISIFCVTIVIIVISGAISLKYITKKCIQNRNT